ncbi:hypothetical protein DMB44_06095 [Thermoplasma sp. Kam2015]|uniref:DsrE family protein n=1 Tax=Thermoplasma sp. Kam2015 TaxID=2094122 RepID=UPI000D9CB385|nr:DsrE family protein [Thermoplasma sp. Kam2015]PYB68067.1 hypothetical protein DMB44_06095 [Thermoplasma sp. Kam2015]
MKAIINVTEPGKINVTIASALNLIREDPDAAVEIVFHSDAIDYVCSNENEERLSSLMSKGVDIVACRNSLIAKKLDEKSVIKGVRIVNAGIYEVLKKESEGWLYIKL